MLAQQRAPHDQRGIARDAAEFGERAAPSGDAEHLAAPGRRIAALPRVFLGSIGLSDHHLPATECERRLLLRGGAGRNLDVQFGFQVPDDLVGILGAARHVDGLAAQHDDIDARPCDGAGRRHRVLIGLIDVRLVGLDDAHRREHQRHPVGDDPVELIREDFGEQRRRGVADARPMAVEARPRRLPVRQTHSGFERTCVVHRCTRSQWHCRVICVQYTNSGFIFVRVNKSGASPVPLFRRGRRRAALQPRGGTPAHRPAALEPANPVDRARAWRHAAQSQPAEGRIDRSRQAVPGRSARRAGAGGAGRRNRQARRARRGRQPPGQFHHLGAADARIHAHRASVPRGAAGRASGTENSNIAADPRRTCCWTTSMSA